MDNLFINHPPFSRREAVSPSLVLTNKVLKKVGLRLDHHFDTMRDMCSVEQRINFFHLLTRVFQDEVEGELVEVGTFTGQCALLFQKVNALFGYGKRLHVFDSFEIKFTETVDVLSLLKENFVAAGLTCPEIHKGYFQDTLSGQLPENIAFVHIDCGCGDDPMLHKKIVLACLAEVYPRLTPGGIGVFMDYFDPEMADELSRIHKLHQINPGVGLAVDEFFSDKPEEVITLFGGPASHAYIRKQG
ncbi:class I SAM-dependent methyltransferase [Echinicola vietnamensis]|uniref:O-methyltransferase n=1 Tax=Echinicola vietnamensis (strain DSM 17526 / LMG 23754 / KMM 6221) TaxID=926556 RepID=L0G7A4_ECHVK|nr:class I SAM-dependent methyltransferase [Echinicola vietnamensis]AGA80735.1 hypothetical protein Echvi_4562 [Echinicola vietnamensis DSM 17526]